MREGFSLSLGPCFTCGVEAECIAMLPGCLEWGWGGDAGFSATVDPGRRGNESRGSEMKLINTTAHSFGGGGMCADIT